MIGRMIGFTEPEPFAVTVVGALLFGALTVVVGWCIDAVRLRSRTQAPGGNR